MEKTKIFINISENEEKYFNNITSLRLVYSDIPHIGDTLTFSELDVNGVYEVVDRILHYEKGELSSVRIIVKKSNKF